MNIKENNADTWFGKMKPIFIVWQIFKKKFRTLRMFLYVSLECHRSSFNIKIMIQFVVDEQEKNEKNVVININLVADFPFFLLLL